MEPTEELWLGLNDLKVHFYFEWSDGTPVTFTTWQRGHPTYPSGLENCVVMKGQDGYWATDICDKKLGYICKKESSSQSSEEEMTTDPGCQRGWRRYGFHCYFVGSAFLTFSDANKTCEQNKAYLTTVENRNEQIFLISLTGQRHEKYFWIGLSDLEEPGTFRWTSGETLLFTHWNTDMPVRERGCVAMRTGVAAGLWDVVSCEERANFLCKQPVEDAPSLAPTSTCAAGWDTAPRRGTCLKVSSHQETRDSRRALARAGFSSKALGRCLGMISAMVLKYKTIRAKGLNTQAFWIGLFHLNPDEGYAWIDGSPAAYQYWAEDEPNNYQGSEHCVMFNKSPQMRWNDLNCENSLNWICEAEKEYKVTDDGWFIYGDKQYYFSSENAHMEKAREICKKNSADLVVIENESERKFLWKYIYRKGVKNYFIGLVASFDRKFSCRNSKQLMETCHATPVLCFFVSWLDDTPVNYVAWAPGEPNFANSDENCVIMSDFGFWKDISCAQKNDFICERHNSTHSMFAPTVLPFLGGCPETWLLFNNKCYKIFGYTTEERLTWHAARSTCIESGGNLVSIHNAQVQAFLTLLLKDISGETWIGLNDINQEHTYVWTDGSIFDYSKWGRKFPFRDKYINIDWNFITIETDCIAMMKGSDDEAGSWGNTGCQHNKSYICQMDSKSELFHSTPASEFEFIHYENSSYLIIPSKMNWDEARRACKEKSSQLASILDYYTNTFLLLQAAQHGEPLWIGLNSKVNGYYRWTDNKKMNYSEWSYGEPKWKIACVYLNLYGTWKTAPCKEEHFPVCQKSDDTASYDLPPETGKCPESDHISWVPFQSHCYNFNSDEMSWSQSVTKCVQSDAEKDKPHGHNAIWMLLTLVLLILVGMTFMVYFLFKIKNQDSCFLQHRTLDYTSPLTGTGDETDFLTDKERNEHSVV
ncbi:macrophage mannose receptor 1-like [Eudromia elegans]